MYFIIGIVLLVFGIYMLFTSHFIISFIALAFANGFLQMSNDEKDVVPADYGVDNNTMNYIISELTKFDASCEQSASLNGRKLAVSPYVTSGVITFFISKRSVWGFLIISELLGCYDAGEEWLSHIQFYDDMIKHAGAKINEPFYVDAKKTLRSIGAHFEYPLDMFQNEGTRSYKKNYDFGGFSDEEVATLLYKLEEIDFKNSSFSYHYDNKKRETIITLGCKND